MDVRRLASAVAVGLLALPAFALAGASTSPTATSVRIGNHPAYVRVVVDFAGGRLKGADTQFFGMTKVDAALLVFRAKAQSHATKSAYGVTAKLKPGPSHLAIALSFRRGQMKYLSYAVVTGNRLAIDLWKSAPPSRVPHVRSVPRGCLSLRGWHIAKGSVTARGTERGVFEHTFQVVVRGAKGTVLGRRTAVHGPKWTATVRYHAANRQTGTLEAVAFSPKDGALACISQARVTLPPG